MTAIIYPVKRDMERTLARVSRQERNESHGRIVQSAARLMRERGIDGASVGEVMKDARLTHGGFYRHFASKDAMVDGALAHAFEEIIGPLEADLAGPVADGVVQRFREFYLSESHLHNYGRGCPAAALAAEIARGPQATKLTFTAGMRRMLDALSVGKVGNNEAREAAAARDLAMLVGAVTIARASDADLAELVLSACRPDAG